jgi:hypothetical protein
MSLEGSSGVADLKESESESELLLLLLSDSVSDLTAFRRRFVPRWL